LTTIAVLFLIALFVMSGFWSASETALASLSKYRIKRIIVVNKNLAGPLGIWLRSPYYLLSTILIGNTINDMLFSNIATLVSLSTFKFLDAYISRGGLELVTWLGVTVLLLVFGEMAPKMYGRRYPERVTLFALPILSKIVDFVQPLSMPFIALLKFIFPKLDMRPFSKFSYLSLEEVRGLISEANSTGELGEETKGMLERTVNLCGHDVTRIMVPLDNIDSLDAAMPEDKLLDMVAELGRSRIPLYRGSRQNIVGFVYAKDILSSWKACCEGKAKDYVRPPYFVPRTKKVFDLLKDFQTGKTHIAFVSDDGANVVGMVTLEDVLESILGDILDEYDLKRPKEASL
jgi:putative hemolysin